MSWHTRMKRSTGAGSPSSRRRLGSPVASAGQERRLRARRAGRHADLVPILLVEGAVGAALRLLRLSGVGMSALLRRHSARRGARQTGRRRVMSVRETGRLSRAGGRQGAARTQSLRPRGRAASPSAGRLARGAGGGARRSRGRGDLTGRGSLHALESGAQPFEIAIAHPYGPKMIVGLEDIFRVVARLAFASEHIFEHRLAIETPGILAVQPVGDVSHRQDTLAATQASPARSARHRRRSPARVPEGSGSSLPAARVDLEGHPRTGAARSRPSTSRAARANRDRHGKRRKGSCASRATKPCIVSHK